MQEYLEKIRSVQSNLLCFLDDLKNVEENYQNLLAILEDLHIHDDKNELSSFLRLIIKISNNYHRSSNFFGKISQILQYLKVDIQKYFSNHEIFNIAKSNKRILLYFTEEKLITFDEYIVQKITSEKYVSMLYPQYFTPEIQPFINEKWFSRYFKEFDEIFKYEYNIKKYLSENFYDQRKIGENDAKICELIRKDQIKEFIIFINTNEYDIKTSFSPSIYETNNFLLKQKFKSITLIEYAAFFGSIQIFKYLQNEGIDLTPSLWFYAIHGLNPEIIQILEDKHIEPKEDKTYKKCFKESIECHHNEVAEYIKINHLSENENNDQFDDNLQHHIFKSFNYTYFDDNMSLKSVIYDLCKYNYIFLLRILALNEKSDFDINKKSSFVEKEKIIINESFGGYINQSDVFNYKEINMTPLFIAAKKNNYDMVNCLLSLFPEIDVNKPSIYKLWNSKYICDQYNYDDSIDWWKNMPSNLNDVEYEKRKEIFNENTP